MFENDDPLQRESLIKSLASLGLDAWELNSGGGTMHVIVTLLDYSVDPPVNTTEDPALYSELERASKDYSSAGYLYVATNSLQTECEVGLMGVDGKTGAQVTLENWSAVGSLQEAVETIQQHWTDRDKWIKAFLAGELVTW